jgi:hypothetical protein
MPFGRGPRRRPVVRGVARTAVVAGTATAVSGRVRRRQENARMDDQQQAYDQQLAAQQAAAPQVQPQPAAAPSVDDLASQLEKLGKLKEQGLLTEDEFAAQKAKLLA